MVMASSIQASAVCRPASKLAGGGPSPGGARRRCWVLPESEVNCVEVLRAAEEAVETDVQPLTVAMVGSNGVCDLLAQWLREQGLRVAVIGDLQLARVKQTDPSLHVVLVDRPCGPESRPAYRCRPVRSLIAE